jgi:hypothetical protein
MVYYLLTLCLSYVKILIEFLSEDCGLMLGEGVGVCEPSVTYPPNIDGLRYLQSQAAKTTGRKNHLSETI